MALCALRAGWACALGSSPGHASRKRCHETAPAFRQAPSRAGRHLACLVVEPPVLIFLLFLFSLAFINGTESSTKPKTHFKNVKNTRKLVFLDETCSYIRKETKTLLNCDMKTFRQKRVKDPLNQTKSGR